MAQRQVSTAVAYSSFGCSANGLDTLGANVKINRTTRLVGLYYRTAAEEFFPAMGAIQMPLLGWSKVRDPMSGNVLRQILTKFLLIGRDGSVLCSMQELHER